MHIITFHNQNNFPLGFTNFFLEPYQKSYHHFLAAINATSQREEVKLLKDRVIHIALAAILAIPLLNSIVNIAIRLLAIYQLAANDLAELNGWAQGGNPNEKRDVAMDRIIDCYNHQRAVLDLSNLSLESLPDVLTSFTHVSELNIRGNPLTHLSYRPSQLIQAISEKSLLLDTSFVILQ